MRKLLLLAALAVFYILFSAKSCNQGEEFSAAREQRKIKSEKDSLQNAFGADKLSETALQAFGQTAKMRFNDFCDYYSIVADASKATEFRNHAANLINSLFISRNTRIRLTGSGEQIIRTLNLDEFIKESGDPLKSMSQVQPDSIWIIKDLKILNDTVYSGILGFSGSVNAAKKQSKPFIGTAEFFVVKREKSFGKETLKAWTVVLGEIEINISKPVQTGLAKN